MRSLFALLACAALLVGTGSAGFVPKLIGDAYVDEGAEDDNFGEEDTLWVSSEDGEPVMVTWLNFMNIGGKSSGDIESATLEIYVSDVEASGEVSVFFSKEHVFEDTLTWSDELEYDDEAVDTLEIDVVGWYTFDATEIVKMAMDQCQSCPFSVVLMADDDATIGFTSKEGSEENKPVLEFTVFE